MLAPARPPSPLAGRPEAEAPRATARVGNRLHGSPLSPRACPAETLPIFSVPGTAGLALGPRPLPPRRPPPGTRRCRAARTGFPHGAAAPGTRGAALRRDNGTPSCGVGLLRGNGSASGVRARRGRGRRAAPAPRPGRAPAARCAEAA